MTGGLTLALGLSLLLAWEVEAQGNGQDNKKELSGRGPMYLGQQAGSWRPLMQTAANLSEVQSIKSSFELRTFDPEGPIFYGDTRDGQDWFVLSLKEGVPHMQINKADVLVSVTGGPKLNDGKWHQLELSSHEKFVVMEVDGSQALVVGLDAESATTGQIRLALGGILVDENKLFVPFVPSLDGCVREGYWLNLTTPWVTEEEELWPCYQNIRPGSYFPGTGFAVFDTAVFPVEAEQEVRVELWGEFSQMDGTVLDIRPAGQQPLLLLVASNNTKDVTLTSGEGRITLAHDFGRLAVVFREGLLHVTKDEGSPTAVTLSITTTSAHLTTWRQARLAIGGLLGDGGEDVGSQYLTGCLDKIQVQGKDVDLDLSVKDRSVSSHSCPA